MKSLFLIFSSLLGLTVKAENTSVLNLNIRSGSREALLRATLTLDRLANTSDGFDYKLMLMSRNNAARLSILNPSHRSMEDLIQKLRDEFGSAIEIQRVPVESMSFGTQDDQIL